MLHLPEAPTGLAQQEEWHMPPKEKKPAKEVVPPKKLSYPSDDEASSDESDTEDEPRTHRQFMGLDPIQLKNRANDSVRIGLRAERFHEDEQAHLANTRIHYTDEWTEEAERDFIAADTAFRAGNMDALGKLRTKFCIAHYRGITYGRNNFTEPRFRREHRSARESGIRPLFSMSVLRALGIDVHAYNTGAYDGDKQLLTELSHCGQILKDILLEKRRRPGPLYGSIDFETEADALQHIYTNNYGHIFSSITSYLASRQNLLKDESLLKNLSKMSVQYQEKVKNKARIGFEKEPDDWVLYRGLFNASNPFLSTGDTPRHAIKYAYGMKFYGDLKDKRLFPSWNMEGKAKKPYSGKVYVLLHSLTDYLTDAPLHVPTLNAAGRIRVGNEILDERETTFPAFVPQERCVWEQVMKFPSFKDYTHWHLPKYGLEEVDFQEYWEKIKNSHTPSDHANYYLESRPMDAWLVNFSEVQLIEVARRLARRQGMILVYKGTDGGLCKELTPVLRTDEAEQNLKKHENGRKGDYGFVYSPQLQEKARSLKSYALSEPRIVGELRRRYRFALIMGDGNCLFHALASACKTLPNMPRDHMTLRRAVVSELKAKPALCTALGIGEDYLDTMRWNATSAADIERWGSDNELMAFCLRYAFAVKIYLPYRPAEDVAYTLPNAHALIQVTVSTADQSRLIEPLNVLVAPNRVIHLYHQGENHWVHLQPL